MALDVETGSGNAKAESYCSVADANTYHAARGNAAWDALASDTVREQCLRRATAYMGQSYRLRWAGMRATNAQALDWPRAWVPKPDAPSAYGAWAGYYLSTTVPLEVVRACAEMALRAAAGDLAADLGQTVTERTIGPITTKYAPGSQAVKRYRAVDLLLGPLLKDDGGATIRLARA